MKITTRIFLALLTTLWTASAASITSGVFTILPGFGRSSFALSADNFSVVGSLDEGGFFAFGPLYVTGDSANLGGQIGGLSVGGGPGIIDGVLYRLTYSNLNPPPLITTNFAFRSGPITITSGGVYSAPFTFSGELQAYERTMNGPLNGPCLICSPGLTAVPLVGQGIATFRTYDFPGGFQQARDLTYTFQNSVPEPTAMLLFLSGSLAVGIWRRMLYRKFGQRESK